MLGGRVLGGWVPGGYAGRLQCGRLDAGRLGPYATIGRRTRVFDQSRFLFLGTRTFARGSSSVSLLLLDRHIYSSAGKSRTTAMHCSMHCFKRGTELYGTPVPQQLALP